MNLVFVASLRDYIGCSPVLCSRKLFKRLIYGIPLSFSVPYKKNKIINSITYQITPITPIRLPKYLQERLTMSDFEFAKQEERSRKEDKFWRYRDDLMEYEIGMYKN